MAEIPNRTLLRGLNMLELLSKHPDGLALFELAEALDLPRSTTFNLAHSLTALDYAWFNEATSKYSLGLKMFEVGSCAISQIDIMKVIRSAMAEIHHEINETMHLGLQSGSDMLYIDKMESTRSIRMTSYVGSRAPLYCTALGKAILATMTDQELKKLYPRPSVQLKPYTPNTITTIAALLEQIHSIRETGYAIEREECNENVCCLGIALCDAEGKAAYALSISAPVFRMNEQEISHYAQLLLAAKPRIERFLHRT